MYRKVTFSQNFDFCICPSHNALKCVAGGKKGKLLCCKHIFDQIKGYLSEIQPKNHQNVQKTHFLQKVPGVNGLTPFRTNFWTAVLENQFLPTFRFDTLYLCQIISIFTTLFCFFYRIIKCH